MYCATGRLHQSELRCHRHIHDALRLLFLQHGRGHRRLQRHDPIHGHAAMDFHGNRASRRVSDKRRSRLLPDLYMCVRPLRPALRNSIHLRRPRPRARRYRLVNRDGYRNQYWPLTSCQGSPPRPPPCGRPKLTACDPSASPVLCLQTGTRSEWVSRWAQHQATVPASVTPAAGSRR